jgi:hypothetical protein
LNNKSYLVVSGGGDKDANVTLAGKEGIIHMAKEIIVGDDPAAGANNAKLTVQNNVKADAVIHEKGTLILNPTQASQELIFDGNIKAGTDGKGKLTVTGKFIDAGGNVNILEGTNVIVTKDVGAVKALEAINLTDKAKLTLQGNSSATNYTYDVNSQLVLEAKDADKTHTGTFKGAGTLITQGNGNVNIHGQVKQGKLHVGTDTEVVDAIGNIDRVEIKFIGDKKTLTAKAGILNESTVDFDNKAGNLVISGAESKLGEITNVAGSTITLNSEHQLTLGKAGEDGELLNLNAGDNAGANSVFVVKGDSFFDTINTGRGKLQFAADAGTISAKKIEGAKINVNKTQTIQLLEKDGIQSDEINFTAAKILTIIGHEKEFGDFKSNVTGANNDNKGLVLKGSGTIKSKETAAIGGGISIAQEKVDIVAINVPADHDHAAKLVVVKGTLRLDSDYVNRASIEVRGTLDLRAKQILMRKKEQVLS